MAGPLVRYLRIRETQGHLCLIAVERWALWVYVAGLWKGISFVCQFLLVGMLEEILDTDLLFRKCA